MNIYKWIKHREVKVELDFCNPKYWEFGHHLLLPNTDCKTHYFNIGCLYIYWRW